MTMLLPKHVYGRTDLWVLKKVEIVTMIKNIKKLEFLKSRVSHLYIQHGFWLGQVD